MRVITIQHKSVLEQMVKYGEYRASEEYVSENLLEPYRFMQKQFHWDSIPIFLSPVGRYVEMGGAKFNEDSVAIELEIPDYICKIQLYYSWSDFIYFMEMPWELEQAVNPAKYRSVEELGRAVIDISKTKELEKAIEQKCALQVTVDRLRRDWLVDALYNTEKLNNIHSDSGGRYMLNNLSYYKSRKE